MSVHPRLNDLYIDTVTRYAVTGVNSHNEDTHSGTAQSVSCRVVNLKTGYRTQIDGREVFVTGVILCRDVIGWSVRDKAVLSDGREVSIKRVTLVRDGYGPVYDSGEF